MPQPVRRLHRVQAARPRVHQQEVVDAAPSLEHRVAFEVMGPVELKGLSGTLDLYRAVRT